jgi:hypothetical protein
MHDAGFDLPPLSTVLRERESKIMHIFDPNPSFPLSTIHIHTTPHCLFSRIPLEHLRTEPQLPVINHFCTTQHMLLPYTSLCHSLLDNYIYKQPLTYNATHFEMVTNTSTSILQNTFGHLRTEPQLSVFNRLRTALYILRYCTYLSILENTFEPLVVRIRVKRCTF